MAQCCALMPLVNIRSPVLDRLCFKWFHLVTFYAAIIILATISFSVLVVLELAQGNVNLQAFIIFSFVALIGTVLYVRIRFVWLATKWPSTMRKWSQIFADLPPFQCFMDSRMLSHRIKVISIVMFLNGLGKLVDIFKIYIFIFILIVIFTYILSHNSHASTCHLCICLFCAYLPSKYHWPYSSIFPISTLSGFQIYFILRCKVNRSWISLIIVHIRRDLCKPVLMLGVYWFGEWFQTN